MAKKRRKRKQTPREKILAEIKQSTQADSAPTTSTPRIPKPKTSSIPKPPKVNLPKSRKKLTANQKEWNRIVRNARAVYRRLEKAGYQSDPSLKAMLWRDRPAVIRKRDLEKLQRELHYKKQYERFYGRVGDYGEARQYSRMTREERKTFERGVIPFNAGASGVDDAQIIWEIFLSYNQHWDMDERTHKGWDLIKGQMLDRWEYLKRQYGEEQGNIYFAQVLQALGEPNFALTSDIADQYDKASEWLTHVFSVLRMDVDTRAMVDELLS